MNTIDNYFFFFNVEIELVFGFIFEENNIVLYFRNHFEDQKINVLNLKTMSRKKHSDDIPYSFVSLTSQLQRPSLEIDLKRITNNSTPTVLPKKHKSSSSSRFSSSNFSDSNYNENDSSSILRPISVETITPPISKNYNNSSSSNIWEETPIKHVKATPSPMEKLTLSKKNKKEKKDSNSIADLQTRNQYIKNDLQSRDNSQMDSYSQPENDMQALNDLLGRNDFKVKHNSQIRYDSQIKYDSQASDDYQKRRNSKSRQDSQIKYDSQEEFDSQTKYESQSDHYSQKRHDLQAKDNYHKKSNSNSRHDSQIKYDSKPKNISQIKYDSESKYSSQKKHDSDVRKYHENIIKREKIIIYEEEEEEGELSEDAIDIDVSDEANERSLNFLDTLINKMKSKSQNTKNSSIDSLNLQPPLSPLTATTDSSHSKKKQTVPKSSLQEQFEEHSNRKTNTIKNKCIGLNKYLEENGYNNTGSESDQNLKKGKPVNNYNNNKNNNDFDFLKKNPKHKSYTVEKENVQICDVRECDYEFESPYPLKMQNFLIFNVDDQPQTANKTKRVDNYSNTQNSNTNANSNSNIATPTQSKYHSNPHPDLLVKDQNEDSCSIPFSNSSSGSQFSSPSRRGSNNSLHNHSPNSPRLSPRLQKMKENSSSRGTSPDAKMLRDKAIGNAYLSTKDQSVWCQLEEYNEEEDNDNFAIEAEPNREANNRYQTAPFGNNRLNRSRRDPENSEMRSKTFNRNNNNLRNRPNNERRNDPEVRERDVKYFSPSRSNPNSNRIENNQNSDKKGDFIPDKEEELNLIDSCQNTKNLQKTEKRQKRIIYAEHNIQTEDISNEEELLM